VDRSELERKLAHLPEAERRKFLGYLRRHIPREEDPRDALQEIFLRALDDAGALRESSSFLAWTWGIAARVAADFGRVALRRRRRSKELGEDPPAATDSPEALSEAEERRARVRAAVAQLPVEERQVIELQVFAELSQGEIAKALGWNEDKVKNKARSARQRLRELLKDVAL